MGRQEAVERPGLEAPKLPGEVSAARFHNRRWTPDSDIEPPPFAAVRGFDGEHILLTQTVNQTRRCNDCLSESAREHELSASPLRQVAQVCGI